MAAVTASAAWPAIDGYTGAAPGPAGTGTPLAAAWPQSPGNATGLPVYRSAGGGVRQAVSVSPQAARWLFPPQTTVPAASAFTRYPIAP